MSGFLKNLKNREKLSFENLKLKFLDHCYNLLP